MSYRRITEYEIVPKESFTVLRGCAGCGRKTHFLSTKKFRVNANGNKLDIWLIYQCESCRHTLKLSIYERQNASSIPKEEYDCFLRNDEELAEKYGRSAALFQKNRAEIDLERLSYDIVRLCDTKSIGENISKTGAENCGNDSRKDGGDGFVMIIRNPYGLKIRPEKQLADILGVSGSWIQKMMQEGEIEWENVQPQTIFVRANERIFNQAGKADGEKDDIVS